MVIEMKKWKTARTAVICVQHPVQVSPILPFTLVKFPDRNRPLERAPVYSQ